ncbi:hypothetical protein EVAR_67328_1 [Eumeta japonica]|uniref:Uncharacterized protein n=1 Tax=Eumeta variegata TaxID=151549 RepID=A0A4C1ZYR4_EUMVA|nr:hypothetical protein EVAR_67328_1 [Eumeta japonica]
MQHVGRPAAVLSPANLDPTGFVTATTGDGAWHDEGKVGADLNGGKHHVLILRRVVRETRRDSDSESIARRGADEPARQSSRGSTYVKM